MTRTRGKAIPRSRSEQAAAKPVRAGFLAAVDRIEEESGGRIVELMGVTLRTLQLWRAGSRPGPVAATFVRVLDRIRRVVDLDALADGEASVHADVVDSLRTAERARVTAEFAARPPATAPRPLPAAPEPPGAPIGAPEPVALRSAFPPENEEPPEIRATPARPQTSAVSDPFAMPATTLATTVDTRTAGERNRDELDAIGALANTAPSPFVRGGRYTGRSRS